MMGVKKNNNNQNPNGGAKRAKRTPSQKSKTQSGDPDETSQIDPAQRIWQVVAMIPKGKVASYGQLARLAGMPRHARLVGRTLSNLPKGSKLPWHRVVNSQLHISNKGNAQLQQKRLLKEQKLEWSMR